MHDLDASRLFALSRACMAFVDVLLVLPLHRAINIYIRQVLQTTVVTNCD